MVRIVKNPIERKSDIIRAARHLFQTKEYDDITLQNVMDYLGIAKGTIYHYFKSKEDLLAAVIEDIVDMNMQKMQNLLLNTQGNALEKIQALIETGNMAKDNNAILKHLHRHGNEGIHVRLLAVTLTKQAPLYGQLIQQGCDEGLFKTDMPLECAEFILTAVQFLTDLGIYPWTEEDLIRRMQAFPKIIEQQLQAAPGSFQFLLDTNNVI